MASLTYAELAASLGITVGSAKNLVRRKRWARVTGNDGSARIAVPDEYLEGHKKADTNPAIDSSTSAPDNAATIPPHIPPEVLEALREQITRLGSQNDRLTTEAEGLRSQVGELQSEVVRHKTNHERAEREIAGLQEQLAAWKANAEWMAQPWIVRLIKSFRK